MKLESSPDGHRAVVSGTIDRNIVAAPRVPVLSPSMRSLTEVRIGTASSGIEDLAHPSRKTLHQSNALTLF